MNIFFLDRDIEECAKAHVNKHAIKQGLEIVQLLCTAINLSGGQAHYKTTHKNHPCSIWVRSNKKHWKYTKQLGLEIFKEYTYRYGKIHKSQPILEALECPELPDSDWQDPPQCLPEDCKDSDAVEAYRKYYITHKQHIAQWKNREIPGWYKHE